MIVNEYKLYSGTDKEARFESIKLYNSMVPPQTRESLRKHYHTSFEISLFRKGHGFYRTSKKTYEICPGDIFFFSTNEEHYITEISEPDDMLITNIHVDPRFLWMNDNLISSRRFVDIFFNRSDSFENRIAAGSPAAERIKELILEAENEFINKKDAFEVMVKLHLFEIMICLIRYYGGESVAPAEKPMS
jgi:mannose-6-phosphate isomerase-like protein (cupin superfamily)